MRDPPGVCFEAPVDSSCTAGVLRASHQRCGRLGSQAQLAVAVAAALGAKRDDVSLSVLGVPESEGRQEKKRGDGRR